MLQTGFLRKCENGIIINTPDVAFERCMLLSVLLK